MFSETHSLICEMLFVSAVKAFCSCSLCINAQLAEMAEEVDHHSKEDCLHHYKDEQANL